MGTSENVSWYGGGGIRTHGTLADTLVFKTRALNHSTTPPKGLLSFSHQATIAKGIESLQQVNILLIF